MGLVRGGKSIAGFEISANLETVEPVL